MYNGKRILGMLTGVVLLALLFVTGVHAQNVTQGYQADKPLENGMIVRLKPGDATKVQAVTSENAGDMLGVTVASSAAPVSLSDPTKQQVFVAAFGQYA